MSGSPWRHELSSVAFSIAFCGVFAACAPSDAARQQSPDSTRPDGAVDPNMGSRFTKCVNGLPVSIGSATESGGASPDIPETITRAIRPLPPLSGGSLLVLGDGTALAASDPERDQVYVVDTTKNAVRATVPLQAGDEPGRLAEDGDGRVHVILRRGGALVTIDPQAGKVTARRAVCPAPRGVAYQRDTDQLHVACAGGEVVSLAPSGGSATRTLTLDRDLRDIIVGRDGSLLISTFRKAEILVVDSAGKLAARLRPGSGQLPIVMGADSAPTRTPSVAWRVVPYDPETNSVLMLHQTGVTDLVDSSPGGYTGATTCSSIVQPAVSLLAAGRSSPPVAGGLSGLTLAIDVALSPDRQRVALAVAGNGPTQGPTLFEESLEEATSSTSPRCPDGINDLGQVPPGQVVAVSYSPTGILFAQTREPAAIWRSDSGTTISLASDARADTGHFLFHANSGGGLACASCHPEGGEDGRVWNLVCSGARRTQSLRGGVGGTAPFHWDGREVDFGALVDDVFSGRMAGPLLTIDQKTALEAWVDTVPAMPPTAALDPTAVARGRALFQDATVGCSTCHLGPLLTNNATVDVGTRGAFQVPSLRGVSWRAPLMHDGCSPTLTERFTVAACGGGDKHGMTSPLPDAPLRDLLVYLQSL